MRSSDWLDSLRHDARFSLRQLVHAFGFSTVVIATLALGIGAATAIFSIVNGVLLRPLPYPNADKVIELWEVSTKNGHHANFADPNFFDLKAQSHSWAALAEFQDWGSVTVLEGNNPSRAHFAVITKEFWKVLGESPERGRVFAPEEQRVGGVPAVLISHAYWQSHFNGAPSVLGSQFTVDSKPYMIVGIMPAEAEYPLGTDIWAARELTAPYPSRTAHNSAVLGRLAPGVSLAQAQSEATNIAHRLRAEYGDDTWMADAFLQRLHDAIVGNTRTPLLVILAASLVLLLIACANVANLMVARLTIRQGEVALRLALGAAKWRLVQQFFVESFGLAFVGTALGGLLALAGVRVFLALRPSRIAAIGDVTLDWRVLAFAAGLALAVAVALSVVSAWRATRGELRDAMAASSRTVARGGLASFRGALTVAELAMSIVLLAGAGLLGRSFVRLLSVDPGFKAQHAVVLNLVQAYQDDSASLLRRVITYDELTQRLKAIPGVTSVGAANNLPLFLGPNSPDGTFLVLPNAAKTPTWPEMEAAWRGLGMTDDAEFRVAGPGYFETMGIPLVRGRLFKPSDDMRSPHVAVISQALAKQRWPNEDPIGKAIEFGNMDGDLTPFTIVGIVGDVRERGLGLSVSPTFYATYRQRPHSTTYFNFVVATSGNPAAILTSVRNAAHDLAPTALSTVRSYDDILSASLSDQRFVLVITGLFACVALLLAALGVYSVISYLVTQRRREIGVRVALGAVWSDVMGLVLGQSARLTGAGILIGLVAALVGTRFMSSLLYGVAPTDPVAFGVVIGGLSLVALVASLVPATRATRVDPMEVLREQ